MIKRYSFLFNILSIAICFHTLAKEYQPADSFDLANKSAALIASVQPKTGKSIEVLGNEITSSMSPLNRFTDPLKRFLDSLNVKDKDLDKAYEALIATQEKMRSAFSTLKKADNKAGTLTAVQESLQRIINTLQTEKQTLTAAHAKLNKAVFILNKESKKKAQVALDDAMKTFEAVMSALITRFNSALEQVNTQDLVKKQQQAEKQKTERERQLKLLNEED